MALKSFKPITPGLRQLVIVDRSGLYKGKPEKSLTEGLSSKGGRNNTGRVTVRFRGGGHKRTYRVVDFKRRGRLGDTATVQRVEYDPNRTAYIALIAYDDGEKAYILAPQRLAAGDKVTAAEQADIKPGNAMPIGNIPVGTVVHNIETKDRSRRFCRAPRLGPMPRSSVVTVVTSRCVSVPVNSVWFMAVALQQSVRCRIRTT